MARAAPFLLMASGGADQGAVVNDGEWWCSASVVQREGNEKKATKTKPWRRDGACRAVTKPDQVRWVWAAQEWQRLALEHECDSDGMEVGKAWLMLAR